MHNLSTYSFAIHPAVFASFINDLLAQRHGLNTGGLEALVAGSCLSPTLTQSFSGGGPFHR